MAGGQFIIDPKTGKLIPNPDYTPPQAPDNTPNIGLNPASGQYEYFHYVNGKPVFDGIQAPPVNMTPGHSTSNSTSSSTSYNESHSFQDPAALALEAQRIQNEITKTQNEYAIALRNGDQRAAEYAQTRLDDLYKYHQTLQYNYAQLAQQGQEGAANRSFTASEGAANRGLTAGEGALNREQQAQLAAINNALSASQFGAQFGLSVKEQQQRQQEAALAAANQFANLISTTDTAALPAFYKAGGGVIANALAGGKDALSDNALLPAARTLRAIANPVDFSGLSFNPTLYSPSLFAVTPSIPYAQQAQIAQTAAPQPAPTAAPAGNGFVTTSNGGAGVSYAPSADNAATVAAAKSAGIGFAYGTDSGPIMRPMMPRYADGSVPAGMHTQFMAGDSTAADPAAGGAHPEAVQINDPTGDATFKVNPLTKPGVGDTEDDGDGSIGSVLIAIGKFLDAQEHDPGPVMSPMHSMMGGMDDMGRYAFGTVPDPSGIAPEDMTFLDQVRALRQGIDTTAPISGGYFNVGYQTLAPSLRGAYESSLQTRFGVPVGDIRAEANRFAIPGIDRNAFTSGYGGGAKQDI